MTWMLAVWLADKASVSAISVTPRYGVVVATVSAAAGRSTASAAIARSQTCGNRVMGERMEPQMHGGAMVGMVANHLLTENSNSVLPEASRYLCQKMTPSLRASCNWGFARVLPVTASFTARFCASVTFMRSV